MCDDFDPWTLTQDGKPTLKNCSSSWPALSRSLWSKAELTEMYNDGEIAHRKWQYENIGWAYQDGLLQRPQSYQERIKSCVISMFDYGNSFLWWSIKLLVASVLFAPELEDYLFLIVVFQCYFIFFMVTTYQILKHQAGITEWSYFHESLDGADSDESDSEL